MISDLHRHYSKANRFDYSKEVKYVDKVIEDQLNHYKEMGYNNYLIYLGDVFDISMRSSESSMKFLSQAEHQIKMASGAFSVVGNHEFTYYASNPFWYLMKEINSNKVSNYRNGKFKAKGFNNHLIIPDRVIDGEVEFLFNHYGCGIEVPNSDKISIGFFHQDVIFKSILEDAKNNNRDVFISNEKEIETKYSKFVNLDKSNALLGYDRCYFGHNHLLYGEWKDDDSNLLLNYLASLGRTNVKEVSDSFLERNIPTIIVKDGRLERVDDNKFNLLSREECVDEVSVSESKKKYEKQKIKKRVKREDVVGYDPIDSLRTYFNNPIVNIAIDEILNFKEDSIFQALCDEVKNGGSYQ